jgi:hypothetical protein
MLSHVGALSIAFVVGVEPMARHVTPDGRDVLRDACWVTKAL